MSIDEITYKKLIPSDRSVTMAQCTRAFVKGEEYGFSKEAAFA